MMKTVFITGATGSGKTTLGNVLSAQFGYSKTSFGDILRAWAVVNDLPVDRNFLQTVGHSIYTSKSVEDYIDWFIKRINVDVCHPFVLDGVRHVDAYCSLKSRFPKSILIFCEADEQERIKRIMKRDNISASDAYNQTAHPLESKVYALKTYADYVFSSDDSFLSLKCLLDV